MVFLLWAGSSPGLALDTLKVSYPSPAPFYKSVAVALHHVVFCEQNLDVKLIVTRAKVDRAALISGDIDSTYTRKRSLTASTNSRSIALPKMAC
jgi:hypothetical protein